MKLYLLGMEIASIGPPLKNFSLCRKGTLVGIWYVRVLVEMISTFGLLFHFVTRFTGFSFLCI